MNTQLLKIIHNILDYSVIYVLILKQNLKLGYKVKKI